MYLLILTWIIHTDRYQTLLLLLSTRWCSGPVNLQQTIVYIHASSKKCVTRISNLSKDNIWPRFNGWIYHQCERDHPLIFELLFFPQCWKSSFYYATSGECDRTIDIFLCCIFRLFAFWISEDYSVCYLFGLDVVTIASITIVSLSGLHFVI